MPARTPIVSTCVLDGTVRSMRSRSSSSDASKPGRSRSRDSTASDQTSWASVSIVVSRGARVLVSIADPRSMPGCSVTGGAST